jgi:hypothetical protein
MGVDVSIILSAIYYRKKVLQTVMFQFVTESHLNFIGVQLRRKERRCSFHGICKNFFRRSWFRRTDRPLAFLKGASHCRLGPEEHELPRPLRLALRKSAFIEITIPKQPLPSHEEPFLPISNKLHTANQTTSSQIPNNLALNSPHCTHFHKTMSKSSPGAKLSNSNIINPKPESVHR